MWKTLLLLLSKIPSRALPSLTTRRRINTWVYAIAAAILLIVTQLEDPNIEQALVRDFAQLACPPVANSGTILP